MNQLTPYVHDDTRLGPRMEGLSERQRLFVTAYVEQGGRNHKLAAQRAGYVGNDNTMAVTAHRLCHTEAIILAIKEESERRLSSAALLATSELVLMLDDPEKKIRLKAIEMVLNRAGMHEKQEQIVKHEHSYNDREQIERIKAMALGLGLDAKKLLGNAGVTIDAEFTEVKPEPAVSGREGLEDIL